MVMSLNQFNSPFPTKFNFPRMNMLNRRGLNPFSSPYRNPYQGAASVYQNPYAQVSPYMLAQNNPNRMINIPEDVEGIEEIDDTVAATTPGMGFNWPQRMSGIYGRMMTNPYDFQSRVSPGFKTEVSRYV
jgi:hypothetical protein